MNEALMRLAGMAGIEGGYWDGLGVRRDLQERTATALLGALDFDATGDLKAQTSVLADSIFLAPLPPTIVLRQDRPPIVTVALPLRTAEAGIQWTLELEDGAQRQGEFVPAHLHQVEAREIEGAHYGRFNLQLPDELPAGYHRFTLNAPACTCALIVAPARCFIPEALQQGARCWGIAVQLYALRSSRNWGIGDFGDLAKLATAAGRAGAAFLGLNPLHARHLANPDEASPYSPSSRLFVDPVYIDIEAVESFASCPAVSAMVGSAEFLARLAATRNEKLVDYAEVTSLKLTVLQCLFEEFRKQARNPDDRGALEFLAFRKAGGQSLARFAEFEAHRLQQRDSTRTPSVRQECPAPLRGPADEPDSPRLDAAAGIEFQIYLQWLATMQLHAAAIAARSAGMSIGLYRDLAVGAASDSAECWSEPHLFASGANIGAPPDMLNRQGQNWGLRPWNPRALAQEGYAPFRRLLAANMGGAGALRIDHVMGLLRLFWIPESMSGADGGYVRNHFDELAAIVALESVRNRCMVVGEDLGSVPEGLRERLTDWGFLSYRVLVYERHWQGDGRFCLPGEYPRQSLAIVATHDMPTVTEYWSGQDISRRAQLGMYVGEQQRNEDSARRDAERQGILWLLQQLGLSPHQPTNAAEVIVALHAAIARTTSMLAVIQLDDLIGEIEPVNVPGTHREYPNWRRKLGVPIEDIFKDPRWSQLAAGMREAGRAAQ